MKSYRTTLMSALIIGLAVLGVTSEAQASRRKPRPTVIRGEIQQLSSTYVVLNNKRVELTARTVYQDFNDQIISREAFTLGDCVKVKLVVNRAIPTAREMEFEDHCAPVDGSTTIKPAPTPVAGGDDSGCERKDGISDDRQNDDSAGRKGKNGRGRGRGRDDRK